MTNKKAKGKRAKTRAKFKARGSKKTVTQLITPFAEKSSVQICIDPSMHGGIPSKKYQGFSGKILRNRGSSYEVAVTEGSISRMLIVHPAHLKSLKEAK